MIADYAKGSLDIRRFEDAAAPASEQGLHAIKDGGLIIDAKHADAREARAVEIKRLNLHFPPRCCGGEGYPDREARTAAERRGERDFVIEHTRDALHNRKPQSQAASDLGAWVEPVEFLKNRLMLRRRDAEPGIVHVNAQMSFVPPASNKHTARDRIFDRIRDQILQQAAQ